MAKGNKIVVSAYPRGIFSEGTLKTGITPKPGTIMQIDVSAGIDSNGKFTFELYDADADGGRPIGPLYVLLPDENAGMTATGTYTDSARCFLYTPLPGEELNCLVADVSGTGDDHAVGEMLIVDKGTGELNATTGTPESEPFMLLETITDPTADTLAHVIYTGY